MQDLTLLAYSTGVLMNSEGRKMNITISCIHFAVQYKKAEQNKEELLRNIYWAAESDSDIIVAPEMSVSGYSFKNREDLAGLVEEEDGVFSNRVAAIAEQFGCYICIGLALRHQATDGYCNSALVRGPGGFSFRYDKVNGEIRWSMPGSAKQVNCFDTPWGKVGVLICSDSYYDLQLRIAALKGADLLLIPANWPPSGLDPVEVWRARALENGVAIAACNRTGKDLLMSCDKAESCLISAKGEILMRRNSSTTAIFSHSLPLTDGRFDRSLKEARFKARRVEEYHNCYRTVNIVKDLGSFLGLPGPGELSIHCLVTGTKSVLSMAEQLDKIKSFREYDSNRKQQTSLFLVSMEEAGKTEYPELVEFAKDNCLFLCVRTGNEDVSFHVYGPTGVVTFDNKQRETARDFPAGHLNIGPARVAFMKYQDLLQPENAVSVSKDGCDLLIVDSPKYDSETRLICGVRTINHLCIALCRKDSAGIWMVPEGHARWDEVLQESEGVCSFVLNTALTRKKRFQDRVDFDVLLKGTGKNNHA